MFIVIAKPVSEGEHLITEKQLYYTGKHKTVCGVSTPVFSNSIDEAKKFTHKGPALRAKDRVESETGYEIEIYDTDYAEELECYEGTL